MASLSHGGSLRRHCIAAGRCPGHELIEEKGYARVVDIAGSLDVKQASVTSMVQKLGELGYLNYEKYRGLVLTPKGKAVATGIQQRHETLAACRT